ncbi:MAG: hypothetical protein FWC55_03570 [Firmicutes bacterium]|nr:hypothetical protein [Bacillota bacterium]
MLMVSIVILIIAAAFLLAEAHIPGFGFFGITGIVLLLVSTVITVVYVPFGIVVVLGEYAVLAGGVAVFVRWAKSRQMYGQFILRDTLNEDKSGFGDLDAFLGKEGVAKTSLRPVGVADFNGVSLEVTADCAYIQENTRIKVTEVSGRKLVVRGMRETQVPDIQVPDIKEPGLNN